jgi:hypothetical protein
MGTMERVTVTLPHEIVEAIDRVDDNRSRFVLGAVRNELDRRRREELQRSLASAHVEAEELAQAGFDEWAARVAAEDAIGLVDPTAGTAVRWKPGEGWEETDK